MGFIIEGSLRHLSFQIGYRSEERANPHEIYGLRVGVYNSNQPEDHFNGLELGIANAEEGDVSGLCLGLYNSARRFEGTSLAAMNVARNMTGFNIGLVNSSEGNSRGEGTMDGLQISAWNSASADMTGVQVGVLMNSASRMYGLQLGVINMASNLFQSGFQLIIPIQTDPT